MRARPCSTLHPRRTRALPDALARTTSVAGLRELARRRLPRLAFDFADGAAEDERTARANEAAFAATAIVPRVLAAPGVPRLATRLLGADVSLPRAARAPRAWPA